MSTEDDNDTKLDEKDESPENEDSPTITEPEKVTLQHMEQIEEAKLKMKYPAALKPGGTAFLQKRLNKGQKYFDSGDYNMAKAKGQKRLVPTTATSATTAATSASTAVTQQTTTGDAIPTPDNLPTRKTSLVQSKLAAGLT